jgi:organic radical activating enzyme
MNYPLAPEGVFRTIQGEGALLGLPMVFVRLAGCPLCDTDYRFAERVSEEVIALRVLALRKPVDWGVWITGGEL